MRVFLRLLAVVVLLSSCKSVNQSSESKDAFLTSHRLVVRGIEAEGKITMGSCEVVTSPLRNCELKDPIAEFKATEAGFPELEAKLKIEQTTSPEFQERMKRSEAQINNADLTTAELQSWRQLYEELRSKTRLESIYRDFLKATFDEGAFLPIEKFEEPLASGLAGLYLGATQQANGGNGAGGQQTNGGNGTGGKTSPPTKPGETGGVIVPSDPRFMLGPWVASLSNVFFNNEKIGFYILDGDGEYATFVSTSFYKGHWSRIYYIYARNAFKDASGNVVNNPKIRVDKHYDAKEGDESLFEYAPLPPPLPPPVGKN